MSSKDSSKIVSFPNLKERLIQKAADLMENKQAEEALPLFRQAVDLDHHQPEALLGLVMCLFELGELKEAKQYCKRMLQEDIGEYYKVLQIYIMILIQLGAYGEGYETLEAVIQEQRLPVEQAEYFYKLYQFCKTRTTQEEVTTMTDERIWDFFLDHDLPGQIDMVNSLKGSDIRRQLSFCCRILKEPDVHPIIKTMVVQFIMTENVEVTAEVTKFNRHMTFDLAELNKVARHPFMREVEELIEDHIGQLNPTLLQVAHEVWHRHLFMLFPFLPEPAVALNWASAIHYVAMEMQGLETSMAYITNLYGVEEEEVQKLVVKIRELEEFSSI